MTPKVPEMTEKERWAVRYGIEDCSRGPWSTVQVNHFLFRWAIIATVAFILSFFVNVYFLGKPDPEQKIQRHPIPVNKEVKQQKAFAGDLDKHLIA